MVIEKPSVPPYLKKIIDTLRKKICYPQTALLTCPLRNMSRTDHQLTTFKRESVLLPADDQAVDNSLLGFAALHDGLIVLPYCKAILRKDCVYRSDNKVKLISGAGAGNEPSHIGFVGAGMLTAAISGNIFSAPSSKAILDVIEEVSSDHSTGTLLIVQNRMGYNVNFALAQMRAQNKGFNVETISVADDVIETLHHNIRIRQGLAGIIFIHKIAGAMADEGQSLSNIRNLCEKIVTVRDLVSVSVHFKSVPSEETVESDMEPVYEIEIGCGSHGEAGTQKIKHTSLKDVATTVIQCILNSSPKETYPKVEDSKRFGLGDNVAVLVNNLDVTNQIRSNAFVYEIVSHLRAMGLNLQRIYAGPLMTLPGIRGFHISLLRLSTSQLLRYLDAPTSAPAWPRTLSFSERLGDDESNEGRSSLLLEEHNQSRVLQRKQWLRGNEDDSAFVEPQGPELNERCTEVLYTTVIFACEALIACAEQLNTMDSETGDGDCGATLARGSNAVISAIKEKKISSKRPFVILTQIGSIIESFMGGLQGGFYSIFVEAIATTFAKCDSRESVTVRMWLDALIAGTEALSRFGKVSAGERTMLNPLIAAHRELSRTLDSGGAALPAFGNAVKAAEKSAMETVYIRESSSHCQATDDYQTYRYPDAGAHAVGIWMRAAYEGVKLKMSCHL